MSASNDLYGRRGSLNASMGAGNTLNNIGYQYDSFSRLQIVNDNAIVPNLSGTYIYTAKSDRVADIQYKNGSTIVMTAQKRYDASVERLTTASNLAGAGPTTLASFGYEYDSLHRRNKATAEDASYWTYGYNDRSEVTSGNRKVSVMPH